MPGPDSSGGGATRRPRHLITASLFGIPFGVAGLAQGWSAAHRLVEGPAWPGQLLWVLAALTYLSLLVAYLRNVVRTGRVATEIGDRTFGPFTALVLILPLLCGQALAGYVPRAGTAIFLVCLTLIALYGGWLSGQWIIERVPLERWHPGYFLPTVAGPLLGAAGCATLGFNGLARLMFGYGMVCWIVLGSIILARLFTLPLPPTPVLPTLVIELAPPVVAGNAWFAINGGRADTMAYALAGYAVLMVVVQLRLIPLYLRGPFVAGVWAYVFTSAATVLDAIRWLAVEQVGARRGITFALLAVLTLGIVALAVRTVLGLRRGTFLPPTPAPSPDPEPLARSGTGSPVAAPGR